MHRTIVSMLALLIAGCLLGARINLGTPGGGAGGVGGASPGAVWTGPPIGIPDPGWGITTATPAIPSPWTAATAGFYYVDYTNAAATDTPNGTEITDANGNRYGWPAVPRQTIPFQQFSTAVTTPLIAGSVVYLAPGKDYNQTHLLPNTILSNGTVASPVFITSDRGNRAVVHCSLVVAGTYTIIENLHLTAGCPGGADSGQMDLQDKTTAGGSGNSDHLAWRNSEQDSSPSGVPGNGQTNAVDGNSTSATTANHIIIYNISCHNNGVYQISVAIDDDMDCIAIGAYVDHLWVLDSTFSSSSNTGVIVNPCASPGCTFWQQTNHIYIGRNTAHDMREDCFWSKQAQDVIFSQNTCYNIFSTVGTSGGAGGGMGMQYGPDNVWFLFNLIHDTEYGLQFASTSGGTGVNIYLIGNVVYNAHPGPYAATWTGTTGDTDFTCFQARNDTQTTRAVNNTLINCGHGVTGNTAFSGWTLVNNLISNVGCSPSSCPGAQHVSAPLATPADFPRTLCGTAACLINWLGTFYTTLASFQTANPGKAAGSVEGNPNFVNYAGHDFHLAAGSAAIDAAGTIVDSVYTTFQTRYGISIQVDFDGKARPDAGSGLWDMGAYER